MATKDSGLMLAKANRQELPGRVPEVKDYRAFSDKALDGEIVESFRAAQEHYNGLRREVVARLLPALGEMRRRHAAQGVRNDLNAKLGLPRQAGWEDYLRARGLRPDTVRNWFSKYAAAKTLSLLVGHHSPGNAVVKPDVNVTAVELVRDIESVSRKEKLQAVVRLRSRLNPTVRKNLIRALKNSAKDAANLEEQLSQNFNGFPSNGKCHQRLIREQMAQQPEPYIEEKRRLAADFKNAVVREISYAEARNLIVANEYLATMGTTEFAFGLFFGRYLAGAVCFGSNAGAGLAGSVCGVQHKHRVKVLTRGCCCFWADHEVVSKGKVHTGAAASYLITHACKQMSQRGYNAFIGIADPKCGELGSIFQSVGWLYCGPTTGSIEKFKRPDGKIYDARNVHLLTRDRTGGTTKYTRTRAQQKRLLKEQGCEFFRDDVKKLRYVGFYGDRRIKRVLRKALRWQSLPYPKRQQPAPLGAPTGTAVGVGASDVHGID